MKGHIFETNLEEQGWQTTLLPFCWFYPGDWDIFEKEGTSEKGCIEIEDWGNFVHSLLGFQENSMQSLSAFCNKINSKSSIFFRFLIIDFSWFA